MRKLIISIILGSIITISCNIDKKELYGKYSFKGENVIDTLIIEKDEVYIHKIYNKNLQLVYQGKDKWDFKNDRITFEGFYNNEDSELTESLSKEDARKFLMLTSFPIYKENNNIIIEVNSDENLVYKKIQ